MFKSSHCPDGKNADALALILACITVTDASMNDSKYVPQRPRKFPSPRWEFLTDMQFDSRRSIGINSCFTRDMCVLMLKISHRPDGKMADRPKSTLIFRFALIFGSIRDMYVPATPANFPSPRWDFHMFCAFACRAAVCTSAVAR